MKQQLEGLTKGLRPILLFSTVTGLAGGLVAVIAGIRDSNYLLVLVGAALTIYSIIATAKEYREMGLGE